MNGSPRQSESVAAREYRYRSAWWLPGGHAQTLWGRFARSPAALPLTTECLRTPDGDNLELHHLAGESGRPHVLFLHGLEGSVRSHYVGGFFAEAARRGWNATLLIFRGCGTAPNVARRFYHSGETSDLELAFETLVGRDRNAHRFLAGVSLGGNVLLRWLGERGGAIDRRILGAGAISVPFDLDAGANRIATGASRIYDRTFVRSLRRKAMAKLGRYPDLFDAQRLARARTIVDFDDAVTAPVHGFRDARAYYAACSSIHVLKEIRVPTLLLSARDDPFLPAEVLDRAAGIARTNPHLTVEFPDGGGHVGFVSGAAPWRPFYYGEWRVFRHFDALLEHA